MGNQVCKQGMGNALFHYSNTGSKEYKATLRSSTIHYAHNPWWNT